MPAIPKELIPFIEAPNSSMVATRDASFVPACARPIALRCQEGGERLTVWVQPDTGRDLLANVQAGGPMAISVTHPGNHKCVQVKGTARKPRPATAEEFDYAAKSSDAFISVCDAFGQPRRLMERWVRSPLMAVEVEVSEVFEQTPGPLAGQRVKR